MPQFGLEPAEIGIRVDQNMIDVAVDETSLHGCIENLERDGRLAAAAGELVLVGDRNVSGGHGGAEQRRVDKPRDDEGRAANRPRNSPDSDHRQLHR